MFDAIRLGASAAGAYEIERSLRFNRDSSHRLAWTPSSAGNRKTWTFSAWVKLGQTGLNTTNDPGNGIIFSGGPSGTGNNMALRITNNGYIGIDYDGVVGAYSSERLRDPSKWYHCVWRMDTTTGSTSNHLRVYVNGTLYYNNSMQLSQNDDTPINNNVEHVIGVYPYDVTHAYRFDGYLADIYFIDGGGHPTDFAETNSITGEWVPKKYAGSYGNNGFHLEFADNSGTGATQMGKDTSGNGNNWTPHNISVSSGHYKEEDSMVDTPTNNFAVLNYIDHDTPTITNGNLDYSTDAAEDCSSTFGLTSGKWYAEFVCGGDGKGSLVGIKNSVANRLDATGANTVCEAVNTNAQYSPNSTAAVTTGGTWTTDDVIGIALDATNKTCDIYKNGSKIWGFTSFTISAPYFFAFDRNSGSGSDVVHSVNFGQRQFAHTPPTGYKKVCSQNLPEPTIKDGTDHYNTKVYAPDGSASFAVTGVGFQPNLVILKSRNYAEDQQVNDSVRGATKGLQTCSDRAETTQTNGLTSFDTDGFTVGDLSDYNYNGDSIASWNWLGSGSNTNNTDGTISSTVNVNATAGFSIVSYTGTGSAATVGHGLGVAPNVVIVKNRGTGDRIWLVYHSSNKAATGAGHTEYLSLNNADESYDDNSAWNDTAPTSTVFSVGTSASSNNSSEGHIAYCWSEVEGYSKFGTYSGTGGEGPFIWTGFKPAFVLFKRTDDTGWNWVIHDNKREDYNGTTAVLLLNDTRAEQTSAASWGEIDFLANGFKHMRSGDGNISSSTNIYMAFAEAPFKYANAR